MAEDGKGSVVRQSSQRKHHFLKYIGPDARILFNYDSSIWVITVYSQDDIDRAVADGALTQEAAASLRAYTSQRKATSLVDEEHFHLLSGFNDIFVTIAVLLVLFSCAFLGKELHDNLGPVCVSLSAWALAEYFTRRRHMALPSIILVIAFVGGVFWTVYPGAGTLVLFDAGESAEPRGVNYYSLFLIIMAASAAGALSAWLHWWRFRVPITVAAGMAALVGLLFSLSMLLFPPIGVLPDFCWLSPILFVAGVAVFALAMRWDLMDIERKTRNSDVAFWLHLLAAPLLVYPVFKFATAMEASNEVISALAVLTIYAVLGIVALSIDRRALLVSALVFLIAAITDLAEGLGTAGLSLSLSCLIIGTFLLLLSAFWQHARLIIVRKLPDGLQSQLPPTVQSTG